MLKDVLKELGVGEEVLALAQSSHIKERLKDNTQRCV